MGGNNRMVEKSKKAIKDALLEIMYEKDFKHITVNELLKRANISRGTFYAHFSNLDDVRHQLIDDLFAHADYLFGDKKPIDLSRDPYPVMLMAADMNLKTWLTKYILSDEELVQKLGGEESATIAARFIAGGVMHAYNLWIQEDFPVSAEFIAQTLSKILVGGLRAFEEN